MIEKVHYLVKLKMNKLDSNSRMDLSPAMIDMFINQEQLNLINNMFNPDGTIKRPGLEANQFTIDEISNLIVSSAEQPDLIPINRGNGVYEIPFSFLKYPYFHLVRAFAQSDCGIIRVDVKPHSELNFTLNDYNNKPNKAWRRAPGKIAKTSSGEGSSLYVYTNDEFILDRIDLEYVKRPREVFIGGYDSLEVIYGSEGYQATDEPVDPEITNIDLLAEYVVRSMLASISDDYNISKDSIMSKI